MTKPRAFVLQRDHDETGVSGTGVVAEGVEFSDGTVALRWTSAWPTSVVFHDRGMEGVYAVHGHNGKTRVVWAIPIEHDPEARCHAGQDGDCSWTLCPQLRDDEPVATGRHCPIDRWREDEAVMG